MADQQKKSKNRNQELVKGIQRHGRSESLKRRRFHKLNKATPARVVKEKKPVALGKSFSVDQPRRKLRRNRFALPARVRPNIVPGSVLVLLAGRYRGKRVVYLKQLPSGLLLVTGPMDVNGVPLRRVNQAYVLSTSTLVDVSEVKLPEVADAWFKKEKSDAPAKSAEDLLGGSSSKAKKAIPQERKDAQANIDAQLNKAIAKVPLLKEYIKSKFTLRRGQYPHLMKF